MDILGGFEVNEMGDVIPRREALYDLALVFVHPAFEITGDSGVQGSRLVAHDVHIILLQHRVPYCPVILNRVPYCPVILNRVPYCPVILSRAAAKNLAPVSMTKDAATLLAVMLSEAKHLVFCSGQR